MRAQYCREKIHDIQKHCEVGAKYVKEVDKACDLAKMVPEIEPLATTALTALLRERDVDMRNKAISTVRNAMITKKNPITGKFFTDRLTEKEVKAILKHSKNGNGNGNGKGTKPVGGPVPAAPIAAQLKTDYQEQEFKPASVYLPEAAPKPVLKCELTGAPDVIAFRPNLEQDAFINHAILSGNFSSAAEVLSMALTRWMEAEGFV